MKRRLQLVVMRRTSEPAGVVCRHCDTSFTRRTQFSWYAECQKNHAASMGGYAVDGCREFMADGEEGTSAAFNCAACGCHRSFHRRVQEFQETCDRCSSSSTQTLQR